MSRTYSLLCHDCEKSLWMGQGHPERPESLYIYYGREHQRLDLQGFLFGHLGHRLSFEDDEGWCDYDRVDTDD